MKPAETRKNFGGIKQVDDYWMWKAMFAADVKAHTKMYSDYKKKGNQFIDVYSLMADVLLF